MGRRTHCAAAGRYRTLFRNIREPPFRGDRGRRGPGRSQIRRECTRWWLAAVLGPSAGRPTMMVPAAGGRKGRRQPVQGFIYSRENDMTIGLSAGRPLTPCRKVKAVSMPCKLIALNHDRGQWPGPPSAGEIPDSLSPVALGSTRRVAGCLHRERCDFSSIPVPNHQVRAIQNIWPHNATPRDSAVRSQPGWTFWRVGSMIANLRHPGRQGSGAVTGSTLPATARAPCSWAQRPCATTLLARMCMAGYAPSNCRS